MKYYQALDTFSADLADGTMRVVSKGEALPEVHELVRRDLAHAKTPGRVALFRPMDEGEPQKPSRRGPTRVK